MSLTRKENVKRAIHFERPDYIPLLHYDLNNISISDAALIPVQTMFGGDNGRTSEWGFVWMENDTPFTLGQIETPAVPDWDLLSSYRPLDVNSYDRFAEGRRFMSEYPDKYYIADFVLSGFTVMSFVRGFEDFMIDLHLERENVNKLADIVFATEAELIRASAKAGFDAIALGDDMGSQQSLLFSAQMFRDVFKERFREQFALAHSLGLDVYLHCCGYVIDLIPEFIEVGLDIFNPGQPALNDISELGKRFKGKICFACPTGYQTTGVSGTKEEIYAEIKAYVDELSTEDGGLIGLVATKLQELGATDEIQKNVLDAWNKYCGEFSRD